MILPFPQMDSKATVFLVETDFQSVTVEIFHAKKLMELKLSVYE